MKKLLAAATTAAVLLSVSASAHSVSLGEFFALFSAKSATGCSGGVRNDTC
ncbi:hypothetical protein [Pseudoduganella flava]|uniref:Uncharacterized protein n=1 Tax=Pseudoduganella flava TaxID=871742 RepID=A0ABX6FUP9_9BURK|nr:hypothetical protein [Pseudoduganella flava]QGZ40426.1 hypothetical protein GO485_16110 [Pseudoduganella flava]